MTQHDPSDKVLIERYLAGDKASLAILVKRWHRTFCEKAYWILRDKNLSKDVAQECWVIIIRQLSNLNNKDQFKSWALRIIYTKSIDAHKARFRSTNDMGTIDAQVATPSGKENYRIAQQKRLLKAIKELSKEKQDIIRLFYLEDYSIKEISVFLQIPLGTVKSRLFKSREKLKSIIKSHHHEK